MGAARSEPNLKSLVEEIRSSGGEAIAVSADTSEFDQVEAVWGYAGGPRPRAPRLSRARIQRAG